MVFDSGALGSRLTGAAPGFWLFPRWWGGCSVSLVKKDKNPIFNFSGKGHLGQGEFIDKSPLTRCTATTQKSENTKKREHFWILGFLRSPAKDFFTVDH